jgi:hypothetical protein
MPEERKPVNVRTVYYICDSCKVGTLSSKNNTCLLTYPPQYRHVCSNCKAEYTLYKRYPYMEYVDA